MGENIFWKMSDAQRHRALDALHDSEILEANTDYMVFLAVHDLVTQHLLYEWVDNNYNTLKLKIKTT